MPKAWPPGEWALPWDAYKGATTCITLGTSTVKHLLLLLLLMALLGTKRYYSIPRAEFPPD